MLAVLCMNNHGDNELSLREKFITALNKSSCHYKHIESSLVHFMAKLEFLESTNRYKKMIKGIIKCNDMSNMKSLVAEVAFAYEFESNSQKLIYEMKQDERNHSSTIDFSWELPDLDMNIYLELKLMLPREKDYKDEPEKGEITRAQSCILSKCQNKNGELIKFFSMKGNSINIIVTDNSYGMSEMFDKTDCQLAVYGDSSVNGFCKRGVYGFFEPESKNTTSEQKAFNSKYSNLRSTIHGILFVNKYPTGDPLDFNYQYILAPNYILFDEKRANQLAKRLSEVIKAW